MPIVDIKGVGRVQYPDYMSAEEIDTAISTEFFSHPKPIGPPEPSFMDKMGPFLSGGVSDVMPSMVPDIKTPIPDQPVTQGVGFEGEAPMMPAQRQLPKAIEAAGEAIKNAVFPAAEYIGGVGSDLLQMGKDAFTGELPAGAGALQKPLEAIAPYDPGAVEKEQAYRAKYPEIAAAEYSLAGLLPGGTKLYSAEEAQAFGAAEPEAQRDEILGETAMWAFAPAVLKGAGYGLKKLIGNIPLMPTGAKLKHMFNLPLKDAWRYMTNDEKAIIQGVIKSVEKETAETGRTFGQVLRDRIRKGERETEDIRKAFESRLKKDPTGAIRRGVQARAEAQRPLQPEVRQEPYPAEAEAITRPEMPTREIGAPPERLPYTPEEPGPKYRVIKPEPPTGEPGEVIELPQAERTPPEVTDLTFKEEVTDAHKDQVNSSIYAVDKAGNRVARLDYTDVKGEAEISWIDVPKGMQRQGIGSELVKQLYKEYPISKVKWGMVTDEGAKLKESIDQYNDTRIKEAKNKLKASRAEPPKPPPEEVTTQYAKRSTIETPMQGVLAEAKQVKATAYKRVKKIRDALKKEPLAGNRAQLRLDLIKATDKHKEAISLERSAKEGIEKRANELGLTTVKPPEVTDKQPWEMTREEWINDRSLALKQEGEKSNNVSLISRAKTDEFKQIVGIKHREKITKAISEGKQIPEEVLKDYPELTGEVAKADPKPPAEPKEQLKTVKMDDGKVYRQADGVSVLGGKEVGKWEYKYKDEWRPVKNIQIRIEADKILKDQTVTTQGPKPELREDPPEVPTEGVVEPPAIKDIKELKPLADKLQDIDKAGGIPWARTNRALGEAYQYFNIKGGDVTQIKTKLSEYGIEGKGALKQLREAFYPEKFEKVQGGQEVKPEQPEWATIKNVPKLRSVAKSKGIDTRDIKGPRSLSKVRERIEAFERGEQVPMTPPKAPPKPKERKGPETIRGRIKELGGINPGAFKGEFKDMDLAAKMITRKTGMSVDLVEMTLKEEGWLTPNESLVDLLRDAPGETLKRRHIGKTDVTERKTHLTESEKRFQEEMAHEPEAPPEGEYKTISARDLPQGKELTLISEKADEGWDVYKVIDKKGTEITLQDGKTIKLEPGEKVQVLKSDIEGTKAAGKVEAQEKVAGELDSFFEEKGKTKKGFGAVSGALKAEAIKRGRFKKESPFKRAGLGIEDVSEGGKLERFKSGDKEVNERFSKALEGAKPEPIIKKAKDFFVTAKNKIAREYEHLPRTAEFAPLRYGEDGLLNLAKGKGIASHQALETIRGITDPMSKDEFYNYTAKVVLDDLKAMKGREEKLSYGYHKKPEQLDADIKALDKIISKSPNIKSALENRGKVWDALKADYIKAMDDIGFDVGDRLTRENYFRHQVLHYVNEKGIFGTGQKLKTPAGRSHLKKREGSDVLDHSANYIQAEAEIVSQMLYDIHVAKAIKNVDKNFNIADTLAKDSKGNKIIPKGYTEWRPREGNTFYMVDTIPEKIATELTSGALEQIGITKDDIKKALALGGLRKAFVVKEEVANTLDNLVRVNKPDDLHKTVVSKIWKPWQLIMPRRAIKYNVRNFTGDADALIAFRPKAFFEAPTAMKELLDAFYLKKPLTGELNEWFKRGGMGSTLQGQEIGQVDDIRIFNRLKGAKQKGGLKDIPKNVWKKYWDTARLTTDFREAILRYSTYKRALKEMQASPDGLPEDFMASKPEEIKAIKDIRDRAFVLSNQALGAYDQVGVFGQAFRDRWFPFWSWKEVNFRRYFQGFKNAANDKRFASMVGRKLLGTVAIRSPVIAYKVGKFAIMASAVWGATQAWNHIVFDKEEQDLPEGIRQKPHIILGKDKDGKIIYFSRLGAFSDLLETFGLDYMPQYVDDYYKGKRDMKDIALDMAKAPANVMIQGLEPVVKTALETVMRKATFPDIAKPRTIRDRGLHLARSIGLENEYIAMLDRPSQPYKETLSKAAFYKVDPLAAAYSDIYEAKLRYLKEQGRFGSGFWVTPEGDALYNYKLALRYKDKKAQDVYLKKYAELSGARGKSSQEIQNGVKRASTNLMPLSGMSVMDQVKFAKSLNSEMKFKLTQALAHVSLLVGDVPLDEVIKETEKSRPETLKETVIKKIRGE